LQAACLPPYLPPQHSQHSQHPQHINRRLKLDIDSDGSVVSTANTPISTSHTPKSPMFPLPTSVVPRCARYLLIF
jgi:hypothetical protein